MKLVTETELLSKGWSKTLLHKLQYKLRGVRDEFGEMQYEVSNVTEAKLTETFKKWEENKNKNEEQFLFGIRKRLRINAEIEAARAFAESMHLLDFDSLTIEQLQDSIETLNTECEDFQSLRPNKVTATDLYANRIRSLEFAEKQQGEIAAEEHRKNVLAERRFVAKQLKIKVGEVTVDHVLSFSSQLNFTYDVVLLVDGSYRTADGWLAKWRAPLRDAEPLIVGGERYFSATQTEGLLTRNTAAKVGLQVIGDMYSVGRWYSSAARKHLEAHLWRESDSLRSVPIIKTDDRHLE